MENKRFGFIYFAQAGDKIKIGSAFDPQERVRTLQTGCPDEIELLWVIPSYHAVDDEHIFHKQFDNDRVNGEWFYSSPVLDWLRRESLMGVYPVSWALEYVSPEGYWFGLGEKVQKARLFKQISTRLIDSDISLLQFCKDVGLSFEEVLHG
jgi:Meiotically up-regulated gene 113